MGLSIDRDHFEPEEFEHFSERLDESLGVLAELLATPDFGAIPAGTDLSWNTEFDTGFAISGVAGYAFDNGFRLELEAAYEERLLNPYIAAERGTIDAVIDPSDTRREIHAALSMLAGKREKLPRRRHDNTPL